MVDFDPATGLPIYRKAHASWSRHVKLPNDVIVKRKVGRPDEYVSGPIAVAPSFEIASISGSFDGPPASLPDRTTLVTGTYYPGDINDLWPVADFPQVTTAMRNGIIANRKKPMITITDCAGVPPGTVLTLVTAAPTYTTAGTAAAPIVVANKRFRCRPTIKTQWMIFRKCEFEGDPFTEFELVTGYDGTTENIVFEDCTFSPSTCWFGQSPYKGHGATFLRCVFEHCADGIGQQSNGGTNGVVVNQLTKVYGCVAYKNALLSPDPGAVGGSDDNAGHVDTILQERGGSFNDIIGSTGIGVCTFEVGIGDEGQPPMNMHFTTPRTPNQVNDWHLTGELHTDGNYHGAGTSLRMYSPYNGDTTSSKMNENLLDGAGTGWNMVPGMTTSSGIEFKNNAFGPMGQRYGHSGINIAQGQAATVTGNYYLATGVGDDSRNRA